MLRTRVGYAGGNRRNPTYYNHGDHSETDQLDFDPEKISYPELLNIFRESHEPFSPASSRQYMSIIFYHNDVQQRLAMDSLQDRQKNAKRRIYTEISLYQVFNLAESYHQKYYLRGVRDIMKEFATIYTADADFINSTAAARVNGYIAGNGGFLQLESEIDTLGLSPAGKKRLTDMVRAMDREKVPS